MWTREGGREQEIANVMWTLAGALRFRPTLEGQCIFMTIARSNYSEYNAH